MSHKLFRKERQTGWGGPAACLSCRSHVQNSRTVHSHGKHVDRTSLGLALAREPTGRRSKREQAATMKQALKHLWPRILERSGSLAGRMSALTVVPSSCCYWFWLRYLQNPQRSSCLIGTASRVSKPCQSFNEGPAVVLQAPHSAEKTFPAAPPSSKPVDPHAFKLPWPQQNLQTLTSQAHPCTMP